jgi:hypothetical protein
MYRETHFLKRDGKANQIVSVGVTPGATRIGASFQDRPAVEVPWLNASLVLDALLRYFLTVGRPILDYKPLRIITGQRADELLSTAAKSVASNLQIPPWLVKRVSYVFDTRLLHRSKNDTQVVLACDVRIRYRIETHCEHLLSQGIPLVGLYVKVADPSGDKRLAPKMDLAGRVARVSGSKLLLHDHREGLAEVEASLAFLEPNQTNVELVLRHMFPREAGRILASAEASAAKLRGGPERLQRIGDMFGHLRSVPLELAPGVPFQLGPQMKQNSGEWFPVPAVLEKPLLVFDPSGKRTDRWNQGGLDKHGPYDQLSFTPKQLQIALVCQAGRQGEFEQFIAKFLDGMPNARVGIRQTAPYAKGFLRRYALEPSTTKLFTTPAADAAGYATACRRAIEWASEQRFRWDLALVQTDDAFHSLRGDDNPYLVTKALFLKHQIPVQGVTLEKMRSPEANLVYIMNNISLASYAKAGGIPWLLSSAPPIAHELIIGLGSHHLSDSRIGGRERVVGITTVFSSDGNYLLDNKTAAIPYADYAEALLDSIRAAIESTRKAQNWRPEDSVRLVFHAFKPFRDVEVNTVEAVVRELGHKHAEFAFLHLVDDYPLHLFDPANQGEYAPGGGRKGVFAPARGTKLQLTGSEVLVSFTGPREVKDAAHGMPQPTLLRLHGKSTFRDMTYLSRQAFNFSCHSWRSFTPAPLPITILYSNLIARMLRGLQDVSDWDRDAMLGRIGRTRWFL